MKRFIIIFNNGRIVQQSGLNATYVQLHSLGLTKFIIDTKEGKTLSGEKWEWDIIPEYNDSSLTSNIKKD